MSELRPIGSIVAEALVGLEPRDAVPTPVLPRPILQPPLAGATGVMR